MIGERGRADGLRRRRMPAHHVAVHVRAVGEVQHQAAGSLTLAPVAAHSVTIIATMTGRNASTTRIPTIIEPSG